MFNFYVGDYAVLILGISECILVAYFYGLTNFQTDINCIYQEENGRWTKYIWWSMWSVVTPVIIAIVVTMSIASNSGLVVGGYVFPLWSKYLGTFITLLPIIGFLLQMIYEIVDTLKVKGEPVLSLFQPDFEAYQPLLEKNKICVKNARAKVQALRRQDRVEVICFLL